MAGVSIEELTTVPAEALPNVEPIAVFTRGLSSH
jgi:hypothetical protein